MLIETDVIVLKLITGQEIIGKVMESDNDGWEMDDVRELAPTQNHDGSYGLALVPYVRVNSKLNARLNIRASAVSAILKKIPKELQDEYLNAVSIIQRPDIATTSLFTGK